MDIQEIEIEIDAQGQVNLHVKGIPGLACLALTSELEKVLGNVVIERQMTPESSPADTSTQAALTRHTRLNQK